MRAAAELVRVARRVVWFQKPAETLEDDVYFLAYLMTYGTVSDIVTAQKHYARKDFRRALENAPPGVFDARSWAYWNTVFGRLPVPPLPKRRIFAEEPKTKD